jgi:hypothetical protein
MSVSVIAKSGGSQGALQINGVDSVVFDSTGIIAGVNQLGVGQTWQNVTGSRVAGTTYYNSTSKPIFVFVSTANPQGANYSMSAIISGITVGSQQGYSPSGNLGLNVSFVVPVGAAYSITTTGSVGTWTELR